MAGRALPRSRMPSYRLLGGAHPRLLGSNRATRINVGSFHPVRPAVSLADCVDRGLYTGALFPPSADLARGHPNPSSSGSFMDEITAGRDLATVGWDRTGLLAHRHQASHLSANFRRPGSCAVLHTEHTRFVSTGSRSGSRLNAASERQDVRRHCHATQPRCSGANEVCPPIIASHAHVTFRGQIRDHVHQRAGGGTGRAPSIETATFRDRKARRSLRCRGTGTFVGKP